MTSFLPLTWIVYRYIILIYVLFGNDEKYMFYSAMMRRVDCRDSYQERKHHGLEVLL